VFVNEIDIENKNRVKLIVWILILSGFVATLYGLSYYTFIKQDRISATTSGYYTLGMYLTAILSLTLMLGENKDIFPKRILWWILVFIFIIGILLTFDRIHWIAMTFAILVTGILKERKLLIFYIVISGALLLFYHPLYERLTLVFTEHDFSERGVIWNGAFMLIGKHPIFGFGQNTFREIFPFFEIMRVKGVNNWHNDYLHLYMESGIVGLGAYLFLIIVTFKSAFTSRNKLITQGRIFNRDLISALTLSFTCFLIGGFILDPVTTLLFLFIYSLIALNVKLANKT